VTDVVASNTTYANTDAISLADRSYLVSITIGDSVYESHRCYVASIIDAVITVTNHTIGVYFVLCSIFNRCTAIIIITIVGVISSDYYLSISLKAAINNTILR